MPTNLSNSRRARRRALAEINVVPYIDVMLVLLVIFMVTAPLVAPSVIDLPSVGRAALQQKTPPLIVNIAVDGALSVRYPEGRSMREQAMSKADLDLFLQRRQHAAPDQPVVIAADKNVQYQEVMKVMSDLKAQRVKRIGLLVKTQ